MPASTPAVPPPYLHARSLLRQVLAVLLVCLLVALLIRGAFTSAYPVVAARTCFIGLALLAAYNLAGRWHSNWLPRWLMQLGMVIVVAPPATFIAYVVSVNGDLERLTHTQKLMTGFGQMTFFALIFGLLVSIAALMGERKERQRADRLQLELDKSALERELLDARLRLLQAQIEPHFLFNTLANIQALVEAGSANAAPVLRHLIAYLRAAMPRLHDADATLGTEWQLVRAYLELMHLRMPDRLQFSLAPLDELASLRFPAMALLTLVENAVKHGIDPSVEGGAIAISAQCDAASGTVTVAVADTGVGMAETAQPGTGLANVRSRLQAYYGPEARLNLHEESPHGLRAELVFRPGSTP